jgi:glutaconate CoA-transferase subunit A
MALVREILRSPLRDLTVVAYGGPDVGLLAAAGKLRKLVFGFVSLDVLPLDMHFRNARQSGAFEVMELDEGMVQLGLRAAAMRVPFLPTPVGLGTDILVRNPGIRLVRSPYDDGTTLVAMPALRLDAALLQVSEADERGNCVILSPDPFFDDLMARAADRVYLGCERIVSTDKICNHERARFQPFDRSAHTRPQASRATASTSSTSRTTTLPPHPRPGRPTGPATSICRRTTITSKRWVAAGISTASRRPCTERRAPS